MTTGGILQLALQCRFYEMHQPSIPVCLFASGAQNEQRNLPSTMTDKSTGIPEFTHGQVSCPTCSSPLEWDVI